jgi:hypothetical protein
MLPIMYGQIIATLADRGRGAASGDPPSWFLGRPEFGITREELNVR